MSLFNVIRVDAANLEDKEIVTRLSDFRETHHPANQTIWDEARRDYLFESGDPSVYTSYQTSPYPLATTPFVINIIRKVVSLISGFQRRTRNSVGVVPIENADQETADQLTKILMWMFQKEGVLETFSDSFNDTLITGLGLLEVWIDYRKDSLSGDIKVDNCPISSVMMDSFFRKKDLSDCEGIWKRSYLSLGEAKSLLTGRDYDIEKLDTVSNNDYQFTYMPEAMYSKQGNFCTYDEFYYKDNRKQRVMVNTETGAWVEIFHDDEEHLAGILDRFPNSKIEDRYVPTVKCAIIVNNNVVYNGKNPTGLDSYPFIPMFAYFRPELSTYSGRIQGIVKTMRDPSYYYNMRKNNELQMQQRQINTGFIYRPDALADINDINKTGEGKNISVKSDVSMPLDEAVRQIQPIPIAATTLESSNILERTIPSVVGVNEEMLGSAIDDKAAALSMLRQRAGFVSLQNVLDNMDYAQKLAASKAVELVQLNFMPAKVKRILNDEPTECFYNRNFGEFDCVIEEGFNTSTQRQLSYSQLIQLEELGIVKVPPDFMIKAATIQNKDELIKSINQQQQGMAQQAQELQQREQQEAQARIKMFEAKAAYDIAGVTQRESQVVEGLEDSEYKKMQTLKEYESAALEKAKTMNELKAMDLDDLRRLLELKNMVKQDEADINKEATESQKLKDNIDTDLI